MKRSNAKSAAKIGAGIARYVRRAKALGAKDAKIIPAESVKTAAWVRLKCQFGCGGYAGRLTCPPYSPTPERTAEALACYERGLLVHGDEWTDIQEIVSALEREIFLDGYHKAFGMGSGPCSICASCPAGAGHPPREKAVRKGALGSGCRYPERARPSMEACGIDVYATARLNGFPIEVLRSTGCAGNYYGLVLIE
jgi:predicted metal-binding protein